MKSDISNYQIIRLYWIIGLYWIIRLYRIIFKYRIISNYQIISDYRIKSNYRILSDKSIFTGFFTLSSILSNDEKNLIESFSILVTVCGNEFWSNMTWGLCHWCGRSLWRTLGYFRHMRLQSQVTSNWFCIQWMWDGLR